MGEQGSGLAEVEVEQLASRGAGERDAVVILEKHDGGMGRLVQCERRAEAASVLAGAVQPPQVRAQEVEDGTVALAEIRAAAVEEEALGPCGRRDAQPDAERIL